ncbi:MAG: hypothetical protein A2020_13410 [Lentisphaerae bacterium GWF2_45_14]|nr:MAG: hypothetical protein A2020_13410 [Lentisphaerae bacterium GWF2_45_14]
MPKRPANETARDNIISGKFTDAEFQAVQKLARDSGLTKSDIMRKVLSATIVNFPEVTAKAAIRISKLAKEGTMTVGAITEIYNDELDKVIASKITAACIKKKELGETKGKKKKGIFDEIGKAAL